MGKLRILWFLVLVGGMCQVLSLACRLWTPPFSDFLVLAGSSRKTSICLKVMGPYQILISLFWLGPMPDSQSGLQAMAPTIFRFPRFGWVLPEDFMLPEGHGALPNLDFLIPAGSYARFSVKPAVYGPHQILISSFWPGPIPDSQSPLQSMAPTIFRFSCFGWVPCQNVISTRLHLHSISFNRQRQNNSSIFFPTIDCRQDKSVLK